MALVDGNELGAKSESDNGDVDFSHGLIVSLAVQYSVFSPRAKPIAAKKPSPEIQVSELNENVPLPT
jgi:hypothetical protein